MKVAVYDTKPYDQESLLRGALDKEISWIFHPFRLSASTASAAEGADAVCVFVNDHVDAESLTQLAVQSDLVAKIRESDTLSFDLFNEDKAYHVEWNYGV